MLQVSERLTNQEHSAMGIRRPVGTARRRESPALTLMGAITRFQSLASRFTLSRMEQMYEITVCIASRKAHAHVLNGLKLDFATCHQHSTRLKDRVWILPGWWDITNLRQIIELRPTRVLMSRISIQRLMIPPRTRRAPTASGPLLQ